MTDLQMMLLSGMGTNPIEPAALSFEQKGDIRQTFQSSLEALVETVADDLLEGEIHVNREPFPPDDTAALMMLIFAPPTWNPLQTPTMDTPSVPPSSVTRSLAVPILTFPSNPENRAIPVTNEAEAPAVQPSTGPMATGAENTKEEAAPLGDIEPLPKPAANFTEAEMCADKPLQTEKPLLEAYPHQVPAKTQSQQISIEPANQQNTDAPAGPVGTAPMEAGDIDPVGEQDAMFLASPQLAVRNPVPRQARQEQTAFEVDLSDEVDRRFEAEEGRGISSNRLVREKDDIEDRKPAKGSLSPTPGVKQAHSECGSRPDGIPPETPKTDGLPPAANISSRAQESFSAAEKEPAPERQTYSASPIEHALDKPKPFFASTGLQLRVGPREDVSIHVNQIAGNVNISVKSADPELTRVLQAGVPDLLAVLNETGVKAEATIPDIGFPIAERKESTISNIANGSPGWSQESSRDANHDSNGQNRRHRRPDQQWKEWLEER